jgi:hypothetical protein
MSAPAANQSPDEMAEPYSETLDGCSYTRLPPCARHELVCARLHGWVSSALTTVSTTRLLAPRTQVQLLPASLVRPDLALVTAATGKLWLAVEIVSSDDHKTDTVVKKQLYEDAKVPRLWMVDPRYDNVEVYHTSQYGLALQHILAGREELKEPLLPELRIVIEELFKTDGQPATQAGQ